jgi:hypothetical protein
MSHAQQAGARDAGGAARGPAVLAHIALGFLHLEVLTALFAHRKLISAGPSSRQRGSHLRLVAAGRSGAGPRLAGTGSLEWVVRSRRGEALVAADRFLAPWGVYSRVVCINSLCDG